MEQIPWKDKLMFTDLCIVSYSCVVKWEKAKFKRLPLFWIPLFLLETSVEICNK